MKTYTGALPYVENLPNRYSALQICPVCTTTETTPTAVANTAQLIVAETNLLYQASFFFPAYNLKTSATDDESAA